MGKERGDKLLGSQSDKFILEEPNISLSPLGAPYLSDDANQTWLITSFVKYVVEEW